MEPEEEVVAPEEGATETADYEFNDTEDDSSTEAEAEEKSEGVKQHKAETPEARRARIKRQYEREFGKPDKDGDKESSKEDGDERYARLELKTEGVTSKKAQDIVLEFAKWKKIDALEAMKSPIVRAEIAELEKKASVPAPSKRTNSGPSDSFEYWVGQAKKGNFPINDSAMMDKLKKARIFTR